MSKTKHTEAPTKEPFILWLLNVCMNDLGPGPKFIPMNVNINLQKCLMTFYIIGLMVHFNNFSDAMFHYLLLHGSYGVFWFLKDTIFPDPAFQSNVTLGSALIAWVATLGPYLVPAYRLASGKASNEVSFERAWVCTVIYVFGVVIMLLADSQKYYVLKYKKGLIADGMMRHSRNPNYLGEMMIYGSFVLLVNDWVSYICIVQVWCSLFVLRMW
jgi:protein-S-isoprenylcysteine O-methyltransferase Ste14